MGCGPSKDANVATGNTVKTKSILKNYSNESNNATLSLSSTATTAVTEDTNTVAGKVDEDTTVEDTKAPVVDKEEVEGKRSEDVEVKYVVQGALAASAEEEEEEGKFIAAGSPDHYFSSRKDEEAVAGVTASAGPVPGTVHEETVEVVFAAAANVKEVEADKIASDGNGEEEGKTSKSRTDSADFKEAISEVEEKAAEGKVTDRE